MCLELSGQGAAAKPRQSEMHLVRHCADALLRICPCTQEQTMKRSLQDQSDWQRRLTPDALKALPSQDVIFVSPSVTTTAHRPVNFSLLQAFYTTLSSMSHFKIMIDVSHHSDACGAIKASTSFVKDPWQCFLSRWWAHHEPGVSSLVLIKIEFQECSGKHSILWILESLLVASMLRACGSCSSRQTADCSSMMAKSIANVERTTAIAAC